MIAVFHQALVVVQALSLASDEVRWLVRHNQHTPPKGKKLPEDYVDKLVVQY